MVIGYDLKLTTIQTRGTFSRLGIPRTTKNTGSKGLLFPCCARYFPFNRFPFRFHFHNFLFGFCFSSDRLYELMYSQDEFVSVLLGNFMFNSCCLYTL